MSTSAFTASLPMIRIDRGGGVPIQRQIYDALRWLGITWSEGPDVGGPHGPYRQSERSDIYKKYTQQLVDMGHAFPCF